MAMDLELDSGSLWKSSSTFIGLFLAQICMAVNGHATHCLFGIGLEGRGASSESALEVYIGVL
jgi:hypothetical protein